MPITSATAAASTRSSRDVQYSSVSSSSQFFMNTPTTSKPCCFNNHAATDESTPPDMPTTTRSRRGIRGLQVRDHSERPARPRAIVVERLQQQWVAMAIASRGDIVVRQPQRAQDARIERPVRLVTPRRCGEGEANECHAAIRRFPLINTDERRRIDAPGGFLERLARRRADDRLASLDVSRRLVEPRAVARLFLDQEEAPIALDDRRDGDCRARDLLDVRTGL